MGHTTEIEVLMAKDDAKTTSRTGTIVLFLIFNFVAGFGVCQALHNLGVLS